MAYDPGAIDTSLSAAAGDDPALQAELRLAFLDGVTRSMTVLEEARGASEWRDAALRLQGLSASFGAVRLAEAAGTAAHASFRDPGAIRLLRRLAARL